MRKKRDARLITLEADELYIGEMLMVWLSDRQAMAVVNISVAFYAEANNRSRRLSSR